MSSYGDKLNSSEFIKPEELFKDFRFIKFFNEGKRVDNKKKEGEVFFSVKFRDKPNLYGYVHKTELFNDTFEKCLFHESPENCSIEIIEWEDKFLVLIKDGIFISSHSFFATKEDINNLFKDGD